MDHHGGKLLTNESTPRYRALLLNAHYTGKTFWVGVDVKLQKKISYETKFEYTSFSTFESTPEQL